LSFLLLLKSKNYHYLKPTKITNSASSLKNIRTLIILLLKSNLQNMKKKTSNLQTISKPRLARNTSIVSSLLIKSDKSCIFITFSTSSWSTTPRCLVHIDLLLSTWGWFTPWLLVLSIRASILKPKWLSSQSSTALLSL